MLVGPHGDARPMLGLPCPCLCVSAGQLKVPRLMVTVREGGADFRETLGDKGTRLTGP